MNKALATKDRDWLTADFKPASVKTMESAALLDLIEAGVKVQGNVSNVIAYAVVELIVRGEYDRVKARFGGGDGFDDPTFLVTTAARKELGPQLIDKVKWSQQQVADLFGVSEGSIRNDVRNLTDIPTTRTDSLGRQQPTRKSRKEPEPLDVEVVEQFSCHKCGEYFPLGQSREIDGHPHCEDCTLDLEQASEHQEEPEVSYGYKPARAKASRHENLVPKMVSNLDGQCRLMNEWLGQDKGFDNSLTPAQAREAISKIETAIKRLSAVKKNLKVRESES